MRHTGAEVAGRDLVSDQQAGDPDGGADRGAHGGRQHGERQHIANSVERGPEVGELAQEIGAGECLERVPDRDPQHGVERHAGPGVRQQGAERHPGPDAIAPEQDRRQSDPGGRPDRRDARCREGEPEAELGGAVVDAGEHGDLDRIGLPIAPVPPTIRASLPRGPGRPPLVAGAHRLASSSMAFLLGRRPSGRRAIVGATALVCGVALALGLGACGAGNDQTEASYQVPSLTLGDLHRCKSGPGPTTLRCGEIWVPFERQDASLGKTRIGFAVLPRAERKRPSRGAIFAVEGGPGYASSWTVRSYVRLFGSLLARRELVLVDQRGTGRSMPLDCRDLQSGARRTGLRSRSAPRSSGRGSAPTALPPPRMTSMTSGERWGSGASPSTATPTAPSSPSPTRSAIRRPSAPWCSTRPIRRGERAPGIRA